ncbi:MAG: DUF2344 domain-containing protein [Ruminiclostridium sp.]|nr:DUF2344 domain-containing protein [Ruminiclostridium sp.]
MENKNIRVFFSKTGRAVYISHLDLYRLFQRAIKRAKLPVWETEGFNPHVYITFALPLALGTAGLCESLDTKLTEDISTDELVKRFNDALPRDIRVISAGEQVRKPTEIALSEYEAEFDCDDAAFDAFLSAEHIPAEKKTKRGIAELDLKQHINVLERRPGYLRFTFPSGQEFNINAGLLFDAFEKISGTEIYSLHITRTEIKCADGENFR